jgi:hypothetical protein
MVLRQKDDIWYFFCFFFMKELLFGLGLKEKGSELFRFFYWVLGFWRGDQDYW